MPIYDYVCSRCDHRTEVVHGIHGHGPRTCPACSAEGTMSKAIVPPAIHFKGTGWAKKDRSATSTPGTSRKPGTEAAAASPAAGGEGTAGTDASSPKPLPTSDATPSPSTEKD